MLKPKVLFGTGEGSVGKVLPHKHENLGLISRFYIQMLGHGSVRLQFKHRGGGAGGQLVFTGQRFSLVGEP